MSEQFNTPEQALIERLSRAPQPELSAEVRDLIRARMLDILAHPPMPVPRPALLRPPVIIVIVLVAALIAGGVLFVISQQNQTVVTPTGTTEPTATIAPTMTAPPTATAPVIVVSPVLTETVFPTITPTLNVTVTLSPTPLPTTSVSTIVVIEGPVEQINGNVITIFGTPIQIPANDPILGSVAVGDMLHVEGNTQTGTTQIVIVAITVVEVNITVNANPDTNTNVDVNVNPSSGEVWNDDGNCAHAPPDWAPANGWRRRCEGKDKDKDKGDKNNKHDD